MKLKIISIIILILAGACKKPAGNNIIYENTPWGEEVFVIPSFGKNIYLITDYNAKDITGANNNSSIQKAIDECHVNGGGTVVIPKGVWPTSYLVLKSGVNLHLDEGAELFFLDSIELYKTPVFTRWEGIECMNYHPLIYAKDASGIAITGNGKITGNGQRWWKFAKERQKITLSGLYDQVQNKVPPEERNCLNYEPTSYLRPSLVQFVNCKNVLLDSIEIGSGPMWTVHLVYCENVVARNLKVITNGINNDGIVPDASSRVLIDNCYFSTGDDCIVIKSGLNEDGWRVGKACERIVIKNCKTRNGHGGVVIGSEMSGGVKNVYAYNCDFSHTRRGLRIKSVKGRGGFVEDIWFKNIRMDSIGDEAIRINMNYGSGSIAPRNDSMPVFRNFHFEDIRSSSSKYCVRITGSPESKISNLSFKNINMHGTYGIKIGNAENCTFESIDISADISAPLMIDNSKSIRFEKVTFTAASDTMIALTGLNSDIKVEGSNAKEFRIPFAGKKVSGIKIH